MGENVGGGSQVCEEGGKLKLKLEAISCLLEVETFQICNLLMDGYCGPCSSGDQNCAFGDSADGICMELGGAEGVGESRFGDISQTPPHPGGSCYMARPSHPVWRVNGKKKLLPGQPEVDQV